MNSKLALAVIAVLLVNVVVLAAGFFYLQGEINSLKQPQSTPTAYPNNGLTSPLVSSTPQPTQSHYSHSYVVYTFNLKSEYINNDQWLRTRTAYNESNSWKDNYFTYLAGLSTYPEQTRDSMASSLFMSHQFVSAEFDASTGKTKTAYNYIEYDGVPQFNAIETYLPDLTVNSQWTRDFE
jgi:hypothetical protein